MASTEPNPAPRVVVLGRRNEKRAEAVARAIVADIADRRLQPGVRLPIESVMMHSYGVGRTTLREALRILEVNGIVTLKRGPGGGPVVSTGDPADLGAVSTLHMQAMGITAAELVDVRHTFEPQMAALAAASLDDSARERLRHAVATGGPLLAGERLHEAILEMAGQPLMSYWTRALQSVADVHELFGEPARHRDVHVAIATAVIEADEASAEQLMQAHWADIAEIVRSSERTRARRVVWQ